MCGVGPAQPGAPAPLLPGPRGPCSPEPPTRSLARLPHLPPTTWLRAVCACLSVANKETAIKILIGSLLQHQAGSATALGDRLLTRAAAPLLPQMRGGYLHTSHLPPHAHGLGVPDQGILPSALPTPYSIWGRPSGIFCALSSITIEYPQMRLPPLEKSISAAARCPQNSSFAPSSQHRLGCYTDFFFFFLSFAIRLCWRP